MPAQIPDNDKPETGSLELFFVAETADAVQFDHFLEYEYTEDFLSPSDCSTFSLAEEQLTDHDKAAIVPGARVDVQFQGKVQSSSIIDQITTTTSRSGGTVWHLTLRDWLSPAVDGQVDPKTKFAKTMTLLDVINAVLGPYNLTAIATDNVANRNAITGRIYGQRTGNGSKKSLKAFPLGNPAKPQPNEGAFAFCSRISQRFGLWIWPSVTRGTVVVGVPDFTQGSRYTLRHRVDASSPLNNVEESHVVKSRRDQPTVILASGYGGGGEFAKSKLRGGIVNPLIINGFSLAKSTIEDYPNVHFATVGAFAAASGVKTGLSGFQFPIIPNFLPLPDPNARPVFLYDPESHTQDQLDAYLRRELSLRMRKALSASYTIEGHALNGQAICVDTMIDVDDDRSDLHIPLWVMARRFSKSASAGTKTTLEAILPGTLLF